MCRLCFIVYCFIFDCFLPFSVLFSWEHVLQRMQTLQLWSHGKRTESPWQSMGKVTHRIFADTPHKMLSYGDPPWGTASFCTVTGKWKWNLFVYGNTQAETIDSRNTYFTVVTYCILTFVIWIGPTPGSDSNRWSKQWFDTINPTHLVLQLNQQKVFAVLSNLRLNATCVLVFVFLCVCVRWSSSCPSVPLQPLWSPPA